MNTKNPAIKRIAADIKELKSHPSSRYHAMPLEEDMFEWHFTIRGPEDTPFSGGIYHGRILLPPEYPFKPPNIIFLTKNGRFEVGTKICLSISAYHEETWQPAWGVRTMLEAIISFLPSEGAGAIGALDWTPEERKRLAIESKSYCCPLCGPVAALLSEGDGETEKVDDGIKAQVAQLHVSQPRSKSERVVVRNLAQDMVLGEACGIQTIPPNQCDVDEYDNPQIIKNPMADGDQDGIPDALENESNLIDHASHIMPSRAFDDLDNNADAEDKINQILEMENVDPSPRLMDETSGFRHRRRQQPEEAPVQAPLPHNGVVQPPDEEFDDDLVRWLARGREREPWRRFLDKILDMLIVLTFMAIMALSFRILARQGGQVV